MGDGNGFRVGTGAAEGGTVIGLAGFGIFSFHQMGEKVKAANVAKNLGLEEKLNADKHRRFVAIQNGEEAPPGNAEAFASYYENEFPSAIITEPLEKLDATQRAELNCSSKLVNAMVSEGRWDWKSFDNPREALFAVTENPSLLSVVTGETVQSLTWRAGRGSWKGIPSDLVLVRKTEAEARQRDAERSSIEYKISANRWLRTTQVSGAVFAGLMLAEIGTRALCKDRSFFQIVFTDQHCK